MPFVCPPDCGHCCSHLERPRDPAADAFRAMLREQGVFHCADAGTGGLAVSSAEAEVLRTRGRERRMRLRLHPRTFLLETRRRLAVVVDWHLAYGSCAFYADFKCTVYEDRPLVCRAYPVMIGSPLRFAPECPKAPAPAAEVREERAARRSIDRAQALVDARAWEALERGRFAKGLPRREAAARARRYRHVPLEEFLRTAPARS